MLEFKLPGGAVTLPRIFSEGPTTDVYLLALQVTKGFFAWIKNYGDYLCRLDLKAGDLLDGDL